MLKPAEPCLLVCTGKDCRDAKGYAAVHELAAEVSGAVGVPCQGICDGPVVGVRVRGELRWFGEVKGGKARRQLAQAVAGEEPGKGLKAREARQHRGKLDHPKKAEPLR